MNTTFYRNDLDNPVTMDIKSVKITPSETEVVLKEYIADAGKDYYLSRFLNAERNSRLNSILPASDLWEVKWVSSINSDLAPWYLLIKNNRILIQNEAGWQLFETTGKKIAEGVKAKGEVIFSKSEDIFYVNDYSGYIQAVDLISGKRKFYIYPFLGGGFERSVIYTNGGRLINKAFELPVMTHNSTMKIPEINILEIINIGNQSEIDEDGVMKSSPQNENLILKSSKILSAVHDSTIIIAIPDHIYVIDNKLQILKDLTGSFNPMEMSLDEEMRIYLIAEVQSDDEWKSEYWMLEDNGRLICRTGIPPIQKNYLAPPAIDYMHNAYIIYEEKIIAVAPSGKVLWEEYIQKPLNGIAAGKDNLLTCEGKFLTSFDNKGVRKLIYNFNEELAIPPLLYKGELYVVTRNNLYCLIPKK